ncbi:hypothetical protein [Serratia fonticola]|uniref:Uncharacterized protein n=1 Tax=Serratia fonticola TaxID=47917 RepID=A0AAW3WUS7_SERFO|nr:hypothetical protein [Serratia fonticola]MBC3213407.1 hypothetical protein [Serratia fonticola]NYA14266.1 hypothetical protein [Serratia fonticola]NYA33908.1 hypothetical protein [Serratia fonticola]
MTFFITPNIIACEVSVSRLGSTLADWRLRTAGIQVSGYHAGLLEQFCWRCAVGFPTK